MKVNIFASSLLLKIGLVKFWANFDDYIEKIPTDTGGVEVSVEEIKLAAQDIEAFIYSRLAELVKQELPYVAIPDAEPEPVPMTLIGTYNMKPYTRTKGNDKSAGRVPRDFQKHDYPVRFVFNNNCGEFTIPTAKKDYVPKGKEHYVYWKWEKGSPAVFTKAGCVASKVTAYKVG
ncbi:hypothetical protein KAU11_08370 [Candidatus Babeliales bacterium]|nr:hypothetical protein [Candidatus Babeliales bacterium]